MKRTIFFIKNKDFKPCVSCIHFIEDTSNYPYDLSANNEKYGKCKLFGEHNLISGNVKHDYAIWCRQNVNKCGIEGKHYSFNSK
jgi:hypothetical protein